MSTINLFTAEELLRKGLEKGERTLPSKGEKEVTPSGSWMEQKQIQATMEARRQLISDQRVEKLGVLSQAEWDEEKHLALVTERRGGHWGYLGHTVDKNTYLHPEEALFLMEVNCLNLKYGGVQVSIQQAYSLLLNGAIGPREYKVYVELSRVGYRVLRTTVKPPNEPLEKFDASVTEIGDKEKTNSQSIEDKENTEVHNDKIATSPPKENELFENYCDRIILEEDGSLNNTTDESVIKDYMKSKDEVIKNTTNNNEQSVDDNDGDKMRTDDSTKSADLKNQNKELDDAKPKSDTKDEEKMDTNDDNQNMKEMETGNGKPKTEDSKDEEMIEIDAKPNKDVENTEKMEEGDDKENLDTTVVGTNEEVTNKNSEKDKIVGVDNPNRKDDCVEIVDLHQTNNPQVIEHITKEDATNSESLQTENWKRFPIVMVRESSLSHPKKPNQIEHTVSTKEKTPVVNDVRLKPREQSKLLKNFRCKRLSSLTLPDYFECIPKIIGKDTVTVAAPEEQYLPRNVFLNKTHYLLKTEDISWKQRPTQTEVAQCSEQPSINQAQIRDNPMREFMQQQYIQQNFFRPLLYSMPPFMQFPFFNPRFKRFGYNQNPYRNFFAFPNRFPNAFNMPQQQNYNPKNTDDQSKSAESMSDNSRKIDHLNAIRRISCRLRKIQKEGGQNNHFKNSLRKLIEAYNSRYNENLHLSDNLALLNDCEYVDTINLDEDERPSEKRKKQCKHSEPDNSDKTKLLQGLKSMATRLKHLRGTGERCFRNRRSLLDAIKIYNKKFNASIYLTSDFEIKDSKQIVLDSSSDSDCVITEERIQVNKYLLRAAKRRKLSSTRESKVPRNSAPCKNHDELYDSFHDASMRARDFYQKRAKGFSKWLPSIEDWGRAEVMPSIFCHHRILNSGQEMFLYNYLNEYKSVEFKDWGQLKSEFWDTLEQNTMDVDDVVSQTVSDIRPCSIEPLLGPEDCTDLASTLQKVRIIKTYTATEVVTTLHKVTFDVYERDVKNFRKTDLPVPAFRIICVDERSPVPDISEVVTLQKPYKDSAPIVLAVIGASVCYVQMTPTEVPVYIKKRFI